MNPPLATAVINEASPAAAPPASPRRPHATTSCADRNSHEPTVGELSLSGRTWQLLPNHPGSLAALRNRGTIALTNR